jgi:hypothetical protein
VKPSTLQAGSPISEFVPVADQSTHFASDLPPPSTLLETSGHHGSEGARPIPCKRVPRATNGTDQALVRR